jgi:hypothetical protein
MKLAQNRYYDLVRDKKFPNDQKSSDKARVLRQKIKNLEKKLREEKDHLRQYGMWPVYQRIIKRLIRGAEDQYIVGEPTKTISADGVPSIGVTIEPRGSTMLEQFVYDK